MRFRRKQEAKDLAWRIAHGHAFQKHSAAFGVSEPAELEAKVLDTLLHPTGVKALPRGRAAYWSAQEQMIVILNPDDADAGTTFRPQLGEEYFKNLGEP